MKKKDYKYRQGRSKQQVERNEKTAMMAFGCIGIAFVAMVFGLLIDKFIF